MDDTLGLEGLGGNGLSTYCRWPPSLAGGITSRMGEGGGDLGAVIAAHQMQAEIQAADHPGGGQDVTLVGEQDVPLDDGVASGGFEIVQQAPVRGDGPAVEQPGGGEGEGTGTQRRHSDSRPVRLAQRGDGGRGHLGARVHPAGHEDEVAARQPAQPVGGLDPAERMDGDRATASRAEPDLERADAAVGPVDAPDLTDHAQVEGPAAGQEEHTHGSHGRKVPYRASSATPLSRRKA